MAVDLHNADCIELLRSLSDKSIDVIVTDPPYGLGEWVGKKKNREKLAAGNEWGVQEWDNKIPEPEYFAEMQRVSKNQIIFGGNYFTKFLDPSPCWIIWDKQQTGNFADCELAWTSFHKAAKKFTYMWNGMHQGKAGGNVKLNEKRVHPTQKPIPLMEWVIANYTNQGDLIMDPFMGSGTTGIACANFDRDFIGVEKEKHFFAIARERILQAENQLSFVV
jgi:DNA modification methylase